MTNINVNDVPAPEDPIGDPSSSFFQLSNGAYDKLKAFVTIIAPALVTLYVGVAGLWDLTNTDKVVGTATLIITFLGVILKVSTKKYDKSDAKYDGKIDIIPVPGDGDVMNVAIPPAALADKDSIQIKVNRQS